MIMIKIRFHVFKTRTVYIILLFCNVYSGMIWEELSELHFSTSIGSRGAFAHWCTLLGKSSAASQFADYPS